MLYEGKAIQLKPIDDGLVELTFDLQNESVNKFSTSVLNELENALGVLEAKSDVKGLLVTSGKSVFIVGADIMEFVPLFARGPEAVREALNYTNSVFNRLEDLPFPTVAAINGYALGGGMEVTLACDFRVISSAAKIGLPEVKLGIIPGWGGTVRLPRLAGVDVAVEWIAGGTEQTADTALAAGVVDGVVEPDQLYDAALSVLKRAVEGKLPYEARKAQKQAPLKHNDMEAIMAFESSKAFVKAKAGRNYPAPVAAVNSMYEAFKFPRKDALNVETGKFVEMAQTTAAKSLVGLFISDQYLNKKAKTLEKQADKKVARAAVLGAGIMGGGIAYQSAYKGVPIVMKDIAQAGIDLGLKEAANILETRVERGRMTPAVMASTLNLIDPALSYDGFEHVDLVVEAVVENPKVKHAVLAEAEKTLSNDTILCSNTSTISISYLAEALERPENFCGMHFFNPVHKMPLVEVIRGEKTSDKAIARTVAYANALGKKAIVVNDCPGFLVNRVLFPYFAGFTMLLRDGADWLHIDSVMEKWGWPMGPAYLLDVIGMDTGVHAEKVMAKGFPTRMGRSYKAATEVLFDAERYGQKNKKGFYDYAPDKKGKLQKQASEEAKTLLAPHCAEPKVFSDEEIIARMMVPMATELARCLEEGVVASVAEADMALIYGLGFPPFKGGVFRWIDEIGSKAFAEMASPLEELGELYHLPEGMKEKVTKGETYYPAAQGE